MTHSSHPTRRIGPLAIGFTGDRALVERFDELYGSFPVAGSPDHTIEFSSADGAWVAELDGDRIALTDEPAGLEDRVTRTINRLVLDGEGDRLHLHAGAVERDGRVVLIVGPSGSGKSTLVAGLVRAGWRLLSDEALGVLPGGRLVPFPRPVTLRRNSWPLFPGLVPGDLASGVLRVEVAPHRLGEVYPGAPAPPVLMVRPDVSQAAPASEPLSSAQTLSTLLEDTLDLERAGENGLRRLLELVEAAPGLRVAGTDLDASCRIVAAAVAEAGGADRAGAVMATVRSVGDSDQRSPAAVGWLFADGSAALHDPHGGALAVVDRAGFEAWKLLGDAPSDWPKGMAASDFVAQLRQVGLLVP